MGQPEPLLAAIMRAGIPAGARLLAAVSGGPDSVALLHTLCGAATERSWSIRVGHVNHGLRGQEADDDERFVRSLAGRLGVELSVAHVDTPTYARTHHMSVELAARELRLAALRHMLESWPGDTIVTGHTQDDQAETVLMRLLRGTGLRGLGGMRARADQVVRPFLSVRHEATVRFLDDRRWPYRLDSSNLAADHRRNQIRTGVLPVLKHLQPQVVEVLARTASMAQDDFDYLQREALRIERSLDVRDGAEAVGASLGAWQALHPALQRLTLRRLVERLLGRLVDLEEAHVCMMAETLRRASGSETLTGRLPHQLTLEVDGSRFLLRRGRVHSLQGLQPTCLGVPGRVQIEIGTLEASVWEVGDRAELRRAIEVCGPLHALCDAGSVGSTLTVRSRRPGDRMRPLGAPGSRRLQDLLIDRHIPRGARALLPVVENDRHIIWIPGVALDQRAAITPVTEQVLHLRLEPAPGWSVLEYAGIGG